jgi:hypothetical protein
MVLIHHSKGVSGKNLVFIIDLLDDVDSNFAFLDRFLFNLIFLRMIKLKGYIRFLPMNLKLKFELCHTQNVKFFSHLRSLELISKYEIKFDINSFHISKKQNSPVQVVAEFLKQIDSYEEKKNTYNRNIGNIFIKTVENLSQNIFSTQGKYEVKITDKKQIIELLKKYFVSRCKNLGYREKYITYSQITQFIKILCREFLASNFYIKHSKEEFSSRKCFNLFMSLIDTTICCIKPFSDSINIQKKAFSCEKMYKLF